LYGAVLYGFNILMLHALDIDRFKQSEVPLAHQKSLLYDNNSFILHSFNLFYGIKTLKL